MPIRGGHVLWAIWSPVHRWAADSRRRFWALPGLYGLIATLLLWPLDPWTLTVVTAGGTRSSLPLGGDIRRELEMLQQFGQGGMTIVLVLAVWMLDPPHRRRLLDWLAAFLAAAVLAFGLKMLVGRPRPLLGEPDLLLGPFGMYPLAGGGPVAHAWEFWRHGVGQLWSMPSSHTVYAVVAAATLAGWYPRLRGLMFAMACFVGLARVAFGAHYPSDVAAGAAIGLIAVGLARHWGWSARPPGGVDAMERGPA
ncbi:MAG: phosphatase PAP2 family protein [Phycisphaerales bacterium]|nr:phosphatase PAP2 family protein [Phycisphaerales bacterium]